MHLQLWVKCFWSSYSCQCGFHIIVNVTIRNASLWQLQIQPWNQWYEWSGAVTGAVWCYQIFIAKVATYKWTTCSGLTQLPYSQSSQIIVSWPRERDRYSPVSPGRTEACLRHTSNTVPRSTSGKKCIKTGKRWIYLTQFKWRGGGGSQSPVTLCCESLTSRYSVGKVIGCVSFKNLIYDYYNVWFSFGQTWADFDCRPFVLSTVYVH